MPKQYSGRVAMPLSPAVPETVRAARAFAGCGLGHAVRTAVRLRDRADFPAFNAACHAFFPAARSTADTRLMIDIAVVIEAIARKSA